MEQLSLEIKNALLKEGASLIGFADIRYLPPEIRQSMDYAISIGVALNPVIVKKIISSGPTREYSDEKVRANGFINYLSGYGKAILQDRGYSAIPMLTYVSSDVDMKTISAPFQHKTAATRAGLGWIGKSALLVTEEYGSAIRFSTILTDAPLQYGVPIEVSRCAECNECASACPAGAIYDRLWDISCSRNDVIKGRDNLINAVDCARHVYRFNEKLGIDAPYARVCDFCVAACPWTKRYVSKQCGDSGVGHAPKNSFK